MMPTKDGEFIQRLCQTEFACISIHKLLSSMCDNCTGSYIIDSIKMMS